MLKLTFVQKYINQVFYVGLNREPSTRSQLFFSSITDFILWIRILVAHKLLVSTVEYNFETFFLCDCKFDFFHKGLDWMRQTCRRVVK